MAGSKLKGRGIKFMLEETEYNMDMTNVLITQVESDDEPNFADWEGSYEWEVQLTADQKLDATSLHSMLWDNAGELVDFVFAPANNDVPSTAQPHFVGTVRIPRTKPDIGGGVNQTWTFNATLKVEGDVTKKTAA